MLQFRVLGPLDAISGSVSYTPGGPKVRQTLALLLLNANSVNSAEAIIDELWDERPPRSACTTIQTYVHQLRRFIGENIGEQREMLITQAPGYLLRVDDEQLDLAVFRRLVSEGAALLDEGHYAAAHDRLDQALRLWRGAPVGNVQTGRVTHSHIVRLEEERIRALELRILADMKLGHHSQVIGELRSLVATLPLNEWFHARLIEALARSGRRMEALEAFQALRTTLDSELGVAPSPEIQRLHRLILAERFGAHTPDPLPGDEQFAEPVVAEEVHPPLQVGDRDRQTQIG